MKKIFLRCGIAVILGAAVIASVSLKKPNTDEELNIPTITMYSPTGEQALIAFDQKREYEESGWYDEPVKELYSEDGRTMYAKHSEIELYKSLGWLDRKPEAEGLNELKEQISVYLSDRAGDWGVFIQELSGNEYLCINEKEYSSASLIKLFTMAAVYNELECGSFEKTPTVSEQLRLMITESDNASCNALTSRLGGGNTIRGFEVENTHTRSIGCEHTNHGSELVTGNGKRVTFTGFNKTSPRDCGRILYKIYYGDLVSDEASREMFELLKNQQRTWKIPASLPEGTVTANKTGETDNVQGDAAMVFSPSRNYIICVIGNGSVGAGVDTIQEVSRITYRYFNDKQP